MIRLLRSTIQGTSLHSQIKRADRAAILDFSRDAVENRKWHSVVGAGGTAAKYLVEAVAGVQYPRLIERGLPTAAKWVLKAAASGLPNLGGISMRWKESKKGTSVMGATRLQAERATDESE